MKIKDLTKLIKESITEILEEGWYSDSTNPIFSKDRAHRELGINPLAVDRGNHASADSITQPSTVDYNGAGFRGEKIVLNDKNFMLYKIRNFGNDGINGTRQFFPDIKALRNAVDIVNGAATRGGRRVMFRFITSEKDAAAKDSVLTRTFCEFSFNGSDWFIFKPNPVQSMKISKLK